MATAKKGATKSAKNKKNAVLAAEVGAGVAAAGAAALAGYYFYGDKHAKKHRQSASKWAKGMKSDVVKQAKKVQKLDRAAMAAIVDRAAAAYEGARSVDMTEVRRAAAELKQNWQEIQREVGRSAGTAKKSATSAKKSVKKATKKAAPKKAAPKKVAKKSGTKAAKKRS
jgi:hypothetical protein